ncbi:MAG: LCP family protein [Candidatus Dormibacteraeota bacterium]|nr:LCP family protein [Candidatus Dormibacteraeota bacterium]
MARLKARRSRYRFTHRLAGTAPAAILVALLLLTVGGTTFLASRVLTFLNHVTGGGVSIASFTQAAGITEPPAGSIASRLKHKDSTPINILLLGYGGQENDAPYLTDSILALRLDPASGRVAMISIPRDLYLSIPAWPAGSVTYKEKVNAAFEVGTDESHAVQNDLKKPEYRGRDGGGHLAEDTVGKVTGLHFDRYAAVDFKAFRQVVDALGGVDVCLTTPLDDNSYPDYHNGYVRGGVHFAAGCQHVNGEQALRLARSRDAVQPEQSSDFGRAKRQQQIIAGVKKQALSVDGLSKALPLMSALNDNFKTDLTVDDITAIYNWSKKITDPAILHYALTNTNLLTTGGCGAPGGMYSLCPDDPSFQMIHEWVAESFPAPLVISDHAPVQVAWSGNPSYVADGVTDLLRPYGFQVANPLRPRGTNQTTVIYDFSGGAYPDTSEFLAQFFKATVVTPTAATPAPPSITANQGFVVYLGHDYGVRWFNLAHG